MAWYIQTDVNGKLWKLRYRVINIPMKLRMQFDKKKDGRCRNALQLLNTCHNDFTVTGKNNARQMFTRKH